MDALRPALRDLVADLLYGLRITQPRLSATGCLTIVTFHRVLPQPQLQEYPFPTLAVTPEELAWFIRFFRQHFACGSLQEMWNVWRPARTRQPLLAITFDDGQLDNFHHARGVLEDCGVRATFFVVTDAVEHGRALWHDQVAHALLGADQGHPRAVADLVRALGVSPSGPGLLSQVVERLKTLDDETRRDWIGRLQSSVSIPAGPTWDGMMSWDHLRTLQSEGHEIGSHSVSHPILPRCDDETLRREIRRSKLALEAELGRSVASFCYPNGDYDDRARQALAQAGYTLAVTTRWGLNLPGTDPLALQRCDMQGATARSRHGEMSAPRLAWRLSGLHPGLR